MRSRLLFVMAMSLLTLIASPIWAQSGPCPTEPKDMESLLKAMPPTNETGNWVIEIINCDSECRDSQDRELVFESWSHNTCAYAIDSAGGANLGTVTFASPEASQ